MSQKCLRNLVFTKAYSPSSNVLTDFASSKSSIVQSILRVRNLPFYNRLQQDWLNASKLSQKLSFHESIESFEQRFGPFCERSKSSIVQSIQHQTFRHDDSNEVWINASKLFQKLSFFESIEPFQHRFDPFCKSSKSSIVQSILRVRISSILQSIAPRLTKCFKTVSEA